MGLGVQVWVPDLASLLPLPPPLQASPGPHQASSGLSQASPGPLHVRIVACFCGPARASVKGGEVAAVLPWRAGTSTGCGSASSSLLLIKCCLRTCCWAVGDGGGGRDVGEKEGEAGE